MSKYKPDQGHYARTTAAMSVGALVLFGIWTLYYFLISFRGGFLTRDLTGELPVLGAPITPALLISLALAAGMIVVLLKFLNRPKVADLLIEVETEMRKCTWPTWNETFTSSMVILLVMVAFTFLLAGMDLVLNEVMVEYVF